jgi:diguanylate cyclase (GGDEF)-like protein
LEESIEMSIPPQSEDDHAATGQRPSALAETVDPLRLLNVARQGLIVLDEIINLLPVGVAVQGADGAFLLVNEAAAVHWRAPADAVTDTPPASAFSAEMKTSNPRKGFAAPDLTAPTITEKRFAGRTGERTLLVARKSVLVRNEVLLLSASLDITGRKQAEEELAQRANFDELTGLPNRSLVQQHIERILAQSICRFAVAFLDVDNFKHINDYYGHTIGDALLVQMSQRIVNAIRDSDLAARISGDEFLLLINPIDDVEDVATIINKIIDCTKAPFIIDGFEIFSSTSIGVSVYPEHGLDYKTLRHNADSAMYQVKRSIKGGAALFDPKIDQSASERVQIEQRLRLAIRDRRFRCAFQPKVDINTEEVVGVEALIRLLDENGEIHGPSSFVGLAVELGLIDDLTHLAVGQIANSIDLINDAFGPQATISINVAAKQACTVDFMRSFIETLKGTNFAERFVVEVTEDAFVAASHFQTHVLPMLRENGVRVSIDDFGTGYSSLSALADITADEIKIDRSFITNIHERRRSQSILRAIESLGAALGMTVIAEGVESFEEFTYLRTMTRIRHAQGFYFARPLFLEEFTSAKRVEINSRAATRSREAPNRRKPNWRSR